ncbi:hypothetical protein FRC17_005461, partial [Serendipita sp. 399]
EKEPQLKLCRLGGAVELITYEKVEYDVFDNDKLKVDFKPLYQSILIYTALDMLEELQKSYQADRKTQSTLILSSQLSLQSLPDLIEEITGFFIAETHVLQNTRGFRSQREVDELWEGILERLNSSVATELGTESDPEVFLKVKESLLAFTMTIEGYGYDCHRLHDLILLLFGNYATLLERQYSSTFDKIVKEDDTSPIRAETKESLRAILDSCWLPQSSVSTLSNSADCPCTLPFSQTFYECCINIRSFVQKFYQFVEGVAQHHKDIDELLGTASSLDRLMTRHISDKIVAKLKESQQGLSQIAQIVTTLEYLETACGEIEQNLASLRSTQRGGSIRLGSRPAFTEAIQLALNRINEVLSSKLESNFEASDFEWTPDRSSGGPSLYNIQMIMWLTTNIDSMSLQDVYKNAAYTGAIQYISDTLMENLTGNSIQQLNEAALTNILVDVDFIDQSLRDCGQPHLSSIFDPLRLLVSVPLNNNVQEYLNPSARQASYASVRPADLTVLLEKLARYGVNSRNKAERDRGERRRAEAAAVARIAA